MLLRLQTIIELRIRTLHKFLNRYKMLSTVHFAICENVELTMY